jgi:secondary thiamine-phosphate synthase enzyme
MRLHQQQIRLRSRGPGLTEITRELERALNASGIKNGLCQVFVAHTSCSLLIQENADPTARADIESFFRRLVPENDPEYTHTLEGADDMPAHLRAALTSTSETIPITHGRLALGSWQGLYLFEHRRRAGSRTVLVSIWGEA